MWPFKPSTDKLLKKIKKKEDKIQKLYSEAERCSSQAFTEKGAKKLDDIDNEINNLKEDMIKMGKLVLEGGKLKRAEDKTTTSEPVVPIPPPGQQYVSPQPVQYNIPPPTPGVDLLEQQKQHELARQQARQEQLIAIKQQQEQQRMEQQYLAQQEAMRQQQYLAQQEEISKQEEMEEDIERTDDENVAQQEVVSVIIKLINDEQIILETHPSELNIIMSKIAQSINDNKILEVDDKVVNPKNILYFSYE